MRSYGRLGSICLGLYLVIQSLVLLLDLRFFGLPILLGVLALIAGVLLLAGR
jgi:hypothetical protein